MLKSIFFFILKVPCWNPLLRPKYACDCEHTVYRWAQEQGMQQLHPPSIHPQPPNKKNIEIWKKLIFNLYLRGWGKVGTER